MLTYFSWNLGICSMLMFCYLPYNLHMISALQKKRKIVDPWVLSFRMSSCDFDFQSYRSFVHSQNWICIRFEFKIRVYLYGRKIWSLCMFWWFILHPRFVLQTAPQIHDGFSSMKFVLICVLHARVPWTAWAIISELLEQRTHSKHNFMANISFQCDTHEGDHLVLNSSSSAFNIKTFARDSVRVHSATWSLIM